MGGRMIKVDEAQLWDAIVGASLCESGPINALPRGLALGMSVKRIKYLCEKWFKQGRWVLTGSMSGTFGNYAATVAIPNEKLRRELEL